MPFDNSNYQPESIGDQRLRILADFLPSVPAGQFSLLFWASRADFAECGSTACACGWATTIPEFKAAGLHMLRTPYATTPSLAFGDHTDFHAAMKFFGISRATAEHLFAPENYEGEASTTDVAARIREHLAAKAADALQHE